MSFRRPWTRFSVAVFAAALPVGALAFGALRLCRPYWVPVAAKPIVAMPTSAVYAAPLDRVVDCLTREYIPEEVFPSVLIDVTSRSADTVRLTVRSSQDRISSTYSVDGMPARYSVGMTVKVTTRETGGGTRVTVHENEYEVITGTIPTIGHAGRENVSRSVPPTTADASGLLRYVGDCLDESRSPSTSSPP